MQNKSLLITLGVVAGAVCLSLPVLAADDFSTYARGHATSQAGGIVYFIKIVSMILGVLSLVGSLIAVGLLAFEKAPPQLQQVGYKGPVIGIIVGGFLCAITWFVGFATKTSTGGDQDMDTWNKLNNGGASISAPGDVNAIASSLKPVSYTAA